MLCGFRVLHLCLLTRCNRFSCRTINTVSSPCFWSTRRCSQRRRIVWGCGMSKFSETLDETNLSPLAMQGLIELVLTVQPTQLPPNEHPCLVPCILGN